MPIMWMRASSFDGVIAKARALQCAFPDNDEIAKMIAEALRVGGPFQSIAAVLKPCARPARSGQCLRR